MEETLDTQHRQAATRLTSGEHGAVKVTVRADDGSEAEQELTVHPLARLIPLISLGDLDRLYDDISEHGVNEPLIMFEGQVLDGRNRLAVASVLGATVTLKDFDGTADEARAFVWSANAARRHLTIPQIGLAADRFGFIAAAKAEAGPRVVEPDGSVRTPVAPWASLAAKRLGRQITPRTLERFDEAKITEAPDTMRRIENGEIRRVDVAVKEAVAERTFRTGKLVQVPPVVPRTPWDRLGCARGDVLAAERSIQNGDRGLMTRQQFAERAREIQAALIRIQWLYRENRAAE
jgi:hypothetical protein